ncbi:MAG: 50S ribosomal protein L17 [Elusimicrobia bacterium RIFCSPLOWO2_12_FULL_59_9]|nr:50S ribosomal protein L17 [Elusimicrobiota bacterium]OGS04429.1 MAG: 50S ribosomal protein L17 [Elusimicrobia bacterium RIFCSPLOWO2_12_FULL_59_9]
MIKNLGFKKLSRTGAHSRAMLRNMAVSLFLHEKVKTTVIRAKALEQVAERILSQAVRGELRKVRRSVHDKQVYQKLVEVLVPRYQDRKGGYTRLVRMGNRRGDNAEIGVISLV